MADWCETLGGGDQPRTARRAPAVPCLAAVAVGIVLDRLCNWPLEVWFGLAAAATVATMLFCRRATVVTLAVLMLWACIFGAWHHWRWSIVSANDIAAWATEDGVVVRLRAVVVEPPWQTVRPGPTWAREQDEIWTTIPLVAEDLLLDNDQWESVSGGCHLTVHAPLPDLSIGERLEVLGILGLPRPAANPGDFDYGEYLRAQGAHAVIRAERAECVEQRGVAPGWMPVWGRWRHQARTYAGRIFRTGMTPETSSIAEALFLGVRREMDHETRDDFARSGLLHVLAISGVNVGLLALWFWLGCRMARLTPALTRWTVLTALLGYLFLTDADPPVWRATIVAVLAIGAGFLRRPAQPRQMIALAALVVLALNPTDLFHAGAQLSFLSVVIVGEVARWRARQVVLRREWEGLSGPTWRRRCWRAIGDAYAVSTTIWLLTAPLVAYRFQLVSPVGLVLNIVLGPLILAVMWLGYTALLVGLMWPAAAAWLTPVLHAVLAAFLQCVRWGGRWDVGHLFVAGPPFGWLVVFYATAGLLLWGSPGSAVRRRAWQALAVWTVCGLAWGLRPQAPGELRMTVLSVGHGLSVVVSCPNGRTLLYDAGGMFLERRVAETALRCVWGHGAASVDALVLSHPDADHYNAVPQLLKMAAVGCIGIHRTFVDEHQEIVREVLQSAADRAVPLVLLSASQSVRLDPDVQIEVVHPAPEFHSSRDNANSLVLAITYAGQTILLTGDLEAEGLDALLAQTPRRIAVLLAPHHGSRRSNPPDLARWARPDYVIASSGDSTGRAALEDVFGAGVQCWTTRESGAVDVRISASGQISLECFKSPHPASR